MSSIIPASLTILHEPFGIRMKQSCDANSEIPNMNDGRLVWIKNRISDEGLAVSMQTVMRWYYGAAMPRQKKLILLSKILGVSPSWLSLGREDQPSANTSSRRINNDGAVNALIGHMQMEGIPCAYPETGDLKSDVVHFYSIISGRQHLFHVASGSISKKINSASFAVPVQHENVIVILVVPVSAKCIQIWQIPTEVIISQAKRDSNVMAMHGKIDGDTLSIGRVKLQAIEDLRECMLN